jgi:two-component system, sensor histidine kinase
MSEYQAANDAPATAPTAPVYPSFSRAHVLIVDDLLENRLMLGVCCDQFGLSYEYVENGREAVDVAQSGRFDVVLMDIFMPRMDGMAATRAIRLLPEPVGAVPIIAVTPAAAPGEILRYLASGMTDVVPKPINPTRLAEALTAALGKSALKIRRSRASRAKSAPRKRTA